MSKIILQNLLKTHTRRNQVFMHISRYLDDYFAVFQWKTAEKIINRISCDLQTISISENIFLFFCSILFTYICDIRLNCKKNTFEVVLRASVVCFPSKKFSYPLLQTIWRNIVYYVLRGFIVINCLIVAAHKRKYFLAQ